MERVPFSREMLLGRGIIKLSCAITYESVGARKGKRRSMMYLELLIKVLFGS
jgi:hypothetical protein